MGKITYKNPVRGIRLANIINYSWCRIVSEEAETLNFLVLVLPEKNVFIDPENTTKIFEVPKEDSGHLYVELLEDVDITATMRPDPVF